MNEINIKPGDLVRLNNMKNYTTYIGEIDHVDDTPDSNCVFKMGDTLFLKQIDKRKKLQRLLNSTKQKPIDTEDLSRPLDLTVKDTDTHLLIIIKEILNGYTTDRFKNELYPEIMTTPNNTKLTGNKNNMMRNIERGESLSWDKFIEILNRLGSDYKLDVLKYEDVEIKSDSKEEDNEKPIDYNITPISSFQLYYNYITYMNMDNQQNFSTNDNIVENFVTKYDYD